MEYVKVTKENLEREHICCAISSGKDIQVASKKAWLAERFDDGYMYIDCLWVRKDEAEIDEIMIAKLRFSIGAKHPD